MKGAALGEKLLYELVCLSLTHTLTQLRGVTVFLIWYVTQVYSFAQKILANFNIFFQHFDTFIFTVFTSNLASSSVKDLLLSYFTDFLYFLTVRISVCLYVCLMVCLSICLLPCLSLLRSQPVLVSVLKNIFNCKTLLFNLKII